MSTPIRSRRGPRVLGITVAVVLAVVFVLFALSGVYADVLWYDQLGFVSVLVTQWGWAAALFGVGFVTVAIPSWLSIVVAYRSRPVYAKLSSQVDRYQQALEPMRRLVTVLLPGLLGLFAGLAAASRWETVAMYLNRTPFGSHDAQFGLDTGFYVFELPFYQSALSLVGMTLLVSTLISTVTAYLYGSIRVQGRTLIIAKAARIQIAVCAGGYLLVQAVTIFLQQFDSVTASSALMTGANYTAVNASIPALNILAAITALVALLFLVTAAVGRWRLPLAGTALLIVTGLVVGGAYPWIVQRFQVDPSAKTLEAPFIQRNINGTRAAYGVDGLRVTQFNAKTTAEAGALKNDAATTASLRLLDPDVIAPAFSQLQQFKQYYSFESQLDVDRYTVDGKNQDTVVAVRDLNLAGLGQGNTWYNSHLVYTHGYGLVVAAGNKRSTDGQPVFLESNIPSTGMLGNYEARVYFGTQSPSYSIVGAPSGQAPIELDYSQGETSGGQQQKYTFSGNGGPKLDNLLKRLVYAIKFGSEQIVLSDGISDSSQILYDRDPAQRVSKAAPYLTLDSDPYPSVVDGRLVWIVDGYTTSDQYPYSTKVSWSGATSETTLSRSMATDQVNYVRNSVKATVDAYDGKVTLYAWDANEPILKTWQKIYPATVKPLADMSGDLMAHVRYPSDLFKAQRQILGQYHVTDAGSFYSREDAWTTPVNPTSGPQANPSLEPPYYLTLQMPGQSAPSYSLYTTFIPDARGDNSRNVLKGYLAVDSNAGSKAGTVASGYGTLRLLALPEGNTVPGPGQVQASFNADPRVSSSLNLLKQGQSKVINGNLLTVPIGGGLLYMQPVYVQSTGETSFPLLQKVLVAFGNQVAFEDTLDRALNSLFGGNSGASAGDQTIGGTGTGSTGSGSPGTTPTPTPTPSPAVTPSVGSTGAPTPSVTDRATLLRQAADLVRQKQAALAVGNLAKFADLDAQLTTVIDRLVGLGG